MVLACNKWSRARLSSSWAHVSTKRKRCQRKRLNWFVAGILRGRLVALAAALKVRQARCVPKNPNFFATLLSALCMGIGQQPLQAGPWITLDFSTGGQSKALSWGLLLWWKNGYRTRARWFSNLLHAFDVPAECGSMLLDHAPHHGQKACCLLGGGGKKWRENNQNIFLFFFFLLVILISHRFMVQGRASCAEREWWRQLLIDKEIKQHFFPSDYIKCVASL